ncbi:hypothetical protein AD998_07000 [bacterium 336/3]|nr:hypothetical protein AD998_07000 [bacterium 336/3]
MNNLNFDIYLNYSNKDNEDGWVSSLQKMIQEALGQLMGEKPVILHYPNQEKPTASTLAQVGVMICVVSPNFIKDINCIEDIQAFVEANEGIVAKRIIKIVKYPVTYDEQPTAVKDLLAYNLYTINIQNGEFSEIKEFFGRENEKIFWTQLLDIAQETYKALNVLRNKTLQQIAAHFKGKTVFLAETTDDLLIERNLIKRELEKFGCVVIPDKNLPSNRIEMQSLLKKDIERSDLAIHLIGNSYGEILEENGISLLELQNSLATEHGNIVAATKNSIYDEKRGFSRIIWVAPYAKFNSERQKVFVDNLRQNAEALEGAEILQVPLEDLKQAIRRVLNEQEVQSIEVVAHATSQEGVYFIYDPMDADSAKNVIEYLKNSNYKVLTPAFENNLLEARKKHIDNLVNCKAAIIFCGKVSKQWIAMKLLDLLKAPGFGRQKPLKYKAILTGSLFQPDDFVRNNQIQVIQFQDGVIYPELNEFIHTIV